MANTCLYEGKEYSNGSELCQVTKLMKCETGNWVDTGLNCDGGARSTGGLLRVTPSATVLQRATGAAPSTLQSDQFDAARVTGGCCSYFPTGNAATAGLRNNCPQCKVAVINFIYLNGTSEIREFRVEGYSHIVVDISGTQMTQIIGDNPCPA
jgi:hypothetical protein